MPVHLNHEYTPEDLYGMPDDQIDRVQNLLQYQKSFSLAPHYYHKYINDLPDLEWHSCSFYDPNKVIPEQKGIYAFSIQFDNGNLPNNSYVMYIGKGGEIGNNSSIKARYDSYVAYEEERQHNLKFSIFFKMWRHHITYSYAVLPDDVSPGEVEKRLNNILQPPLSKNDYSAEVRTDRIGAQI